MSVHVSFVILIVEVIMTRIMIIKTITENIREIFEAVVRDNFNPLYHNNQNYGVEVSCKSKAYVMLVLVESNNRNQMVDKEDAVASCNDA